jgi:hypothetical protein
MALTEITAPSALPTTQSDYEAQNDLINAIHLDPDKIFHIDFDNDEIPQGTILNVGGTILKAETAESITGTKSNYVKIDATAYTASYVSSLSGVTWNSAYNGYYDSSSPANLYIFDESTAYFNGDITVLHRLYSQVRKQVFEEIGVLMPNWTTVVKSGTDFALAMLAPTLSKMDDNLVAFADTTGGELRTYEYDIQTATYALVGSGYAIASLANSRLATLTSSVVALWDEGNTRLGAHTWNGSTWSVTGSQLTITTTAGSRSDIASLDSTDIAMVVPISGTYYLRTYRWSGSAWSQIGTSLSLGLTSAISLPSIYKLNSTTIAMVDGTAEDLITYTWNGSSWSQTGNIFNLDTLVTNPKVTGINETDIIMIDGGTGNITVFRWDGSDWTILISDSCTDATGGLSICETTFSFFAISSGGNSVIARYHINNEPIPKTT